MRRRRTSSPTRTMSPGVAAARGLLPRSDDEATAPVQGTLDDEADEAEPDTRGDRDVRILSNRTPAHEARFGLRNERGLLLATGTVPSLCGMRERSQPPGEAWRLVRLARRGRRFAS